MSEGKTASANKVDKYSPKSISLEGKNIDIEVSGFGVKLDGDNIEDIIKEEVGIESYEGKVEFRGDVMLSLRKSERNVKVDSDFKIDKEKEE